MIDATYFRTRLAADVRAFEHGPIVEVHLLNGQSHRLRNVLEVQEGYIILEAYRTRAEETMARREHVDEVFGVPSDRDIERAVVSYESIVQVLVIPSRPGGSPAIGFGGMPRALRRDA